MYRQNLKITLLLTILIKISEANFPSAPSACGTDLQTKILNQMFTSSNAQNQYNKDIRPPPGDNATLVTVNMAIRNIFWVDEAIHQWNVDLFFRSEWDDTRLQYYQSLQGCRNLQYITLTSPEALGKLWKPSPLFFTTEVESNIHEVLSRNEVARIYPSGHVWHSIHARVTLFCSGTGSRPGEVSCPLAVYPYGPTKEEIVLRWLAQDPIQIDRTQIILDNHIVGDINIGVEDTIAQTGTYSTLVAQFRFPRKACFS